MLALVAAAAARAVAAPAEGSHCAMQWIEPPPGAAATATSNVIFLNNCLGAGDCVLTPGMVNDSRTNVSTLAQAPTTLEPWKFTLPQWDALVACVREVYRPFQVEIVTIEPSNTTEYFEAMVAGRGAQLGQGAGTVGVAPFTCGVIPNAIAFSFANDYPNLDPVNAADLCWTVTHEIAHIFGLQHKFDARDPMTYLQPALPQKLFLNDDGPCGTSAARDCTMADDFEARGCPGPTTTNSYAKLAEVFDAQALPAPELTVTEPGDGAELARGFTVKAMASDDVRLRDVTLKLDGVAIGQPLRVPPFEWRTPRGLADGAHALELRATDYYGASTTVTLSVTTAQECTGAATGCGAGRLCLDGRCIVGPTEDGGLGRRCVGHDSCASGVCATSGEQRYCVEDCVVAADQCPDGFQCLAAGAGGVCWPEPTDDGGCSTADPRPAPLVLALLFAVAVLVPRRRRAARGPTP